MSQSTYIVEEELLASNGQRFLNYTIDYALTYVFSYAFGLVLPFVINVLDSIGLTGFGFWVYNSGNVTWFFVSIAIAIIYYVLTEGLFGRTLGKLVTGTIVVNENGLKPGFGTIFKRTLCRSIPFDAFSFLGSRGWHDSISDTYVVSKQGLEEDIKMFEEFRLIGVQETD
ncbi:RDD family protein [Flavobacterium cheongpyeongense]|jgi:uncharacterized RDD family membrane protein YckC|uniref:RDD family protein n=1 Tax=Flavobacterium cheongpyeongense TaxID=2212651 RepID=A0A2V4BR75_9FLAO|nr:RDD family protein [Flavobacterium cheongpyeongense]PXY41515.1 RDD family protein [Flavobacterium cheongpyeongense]